LTSPTENEHCVSSPVGQYATDKGTLLQNRVIFVGIQTMLQRGRQRNGSICGRARDFLLVQLIQTGPWHHAASHSSELKQPMHEIDHFVWQRK